ncbi:hypothetical protein ACKUG4_10675 [Pseudomonas glycinae]|uniref:hypothetical protein n=1 Tax=Pseudomonas TaxID=286 RepID=UPI0007E3219A|nr:hypothetical protein [Pseudomonas sp. DR 5-09]
MLLRFLAPGAVVLTRFGIVQVQASRISLILILPMRSSLDLASKSMTFSTGLYRKRRYLLAWLLLAKKAGEASYEKADRRDRLFYACENR